MSTWHSLPWGLGKDWTCDSMGINEKQGRAQGILGNYQAFLRKPVEKPALSLDGMSGPAMVILLASRKSA